MADGVEEREEGTLPPSRTQLKKADHARQKLGERLAGLSAEQLERMELPGELREAVLVAARTTAFTARRRHMKHIGTVLRGMDIGPVEEALARIDRGDHEQALVFRKLESWRDRLRGGDMALVEEILAACPGAQRQQLSQLARNAKKEFEVGGQGGKASKALFRYLKEIVACVPAK